MAQTPAASRTPLLVYVDTNILVFWMLPTLHSPGRRNQAAHRVSHGETKRLISTFTTHRTPPGNLAMVTCQWALTEAHSVLYRDALWQSGSIPANQRSDPRKRFPPDNSCLKRATSLLASSVTNLRKSITLGIAAPGTAVWTTAHRISQECGIYAPDSLHLAAALHEGCDLLVSSDIDFLNKIYHLEQSGFLAVISRQVLPSASAPFLQACPLRSSARLQTSRAPARQLLAQLGYT